MIQSRHVLYSFTPLCCAFVFTCLLLQPWSSYPVVRLTLGCGHYMKVSNIKTQDNSRMFYSFSVAPFVYAPLSSLTGIADLLFFNTWLTCVLASLRGRISWYHFFASVMECAYPCNHLCAPCNSMLKLNRYVKILHMIPRHIPPPRDRSPRIYVQCRALNRAWHSRFNKTPASFASRTTLNLTKEQRARL